MPVFNDAKLLAKYLKKAADATLAESLITTQSELGNTDVSPYRDGRFRRSWFAAEGNASGAMAEEGANSPNTDAMNLRVDSNREYHLTNSLPYAQALCIEGRVVSKSPNWFREFRASRVPKIQQAAAQAVKREYDL